MKFLKLPMRKNSTLIYFVNHLKSESESDLASEFDDLISNFLEELSEKESSPSEMTIRNILNFSRSYDVKKTESAGYVEINLN